jgi:hypothetical protein
VSFAVRCVVERNGKHWQARHVASPRYLDSVEPFLETKNKRRQVMRARQFYAERIFRKMFGIVKKGGKTRTSLTRETALLMWVARREKARRNAMSAGQLFLMRAAERL